ncbi:MAG: hypothetical protein KDA50_03305 [Rhodobacteraceae bacterium]|nr:hypothetical protein [Paracoccaceae bacterium]
MTTRVLMFRWIVFLLAAFYFAEQFWVREFGNMDKFGWQFRYLTIWALTGSMISAGLMLRPGWGTPGDARGEVLAGLVGVINMMVVVSYWRLYFTDPALVNGDNTPVLHREYYLHLLGPLLQWIDMLWIKRAFRRYAPVAVWLAVLVVVYLTWTELVVSPLNAEPAGDVTNGLPYPFLNDMVPGQRAIFYGITFVSGLVFAAAFRGAQMLLARRAAR